MSDYHQTVEYDPVVGISSARLSYMGPQGTVSIPIAPSKEAPRVSRVWDGPIEPTVWAELRKAYEEFFR